MKDGVIVDDEDKTPLELDPLKIDAFHNFLRKNLPPNCCTIVKLYRRDEDKKNISLLYDPEDESSRWTSTPGHSVIYYKNHDDTEVYEVDPLLNRHRNIRALKLSSLVSYWSKVRTTSISLMLQKEGATMINPDAPIRIGGKTRKHKLYKYKVISKKRKRKTRR